jgi:hypothetical protein
LGFGGGGLGGRLHLLFLLLFFIITLNFFVSEEVGLLVGLEEAGDVEGAVALDEQGDLVEQ